MKTETPNNSKKPSSGAQNSKANDTRITVKSAVIHTLRKEGYTIRTDMMRVDCATGKATEHQADIAVYSMAGGGV